MTVVNTARSRLTVRERVAQVTAVGACFAIAWTVLVAAGGGLNIRIGSFTVASHAVWRPMIVAIALYAITYAATRREARGVPWDRLSHPTLKLSAVFAIGVALIVLVFSLRYGARTAGGADALGYVSQAHLFVR